MIVLNGSLTMPMMKENSEDVQCRLCTSFGGGQIIEIFGDNGKARKVAKKIEECLPISVARGDGFPKTICLTCLDKLEQFYVFREECTKSEAAFEKSWENSHPHQNIEFSLEPECCLQENESDAPIVTESGYPEVIPQPKKLNRGFDDFIITPILPNSFTNNNHLTSTPKSPRIKNNHFPDSPLQSSHRPPIGEPNPDDYILVKEESIIVDKVSNNLIEFYNHGNADLDIISEQKRRHEILPPIWDVYEKIITKPRTTESLELEKKTSGASDISMNGNKIISPIEKVTKENAENAETGNSDQSTDSKLIPEDLENTDESKNVVENCSKVIHRRYIINKETFPCSLCGNCFQVNQGFPRKNLSNGFNQNNVNYLNNTVKPAIIYQINKKYDTAIKKPNNALTPKKPFSSSHFELNRKAPSALGIISPPKSILQAKVTQIVNTKHQFVSQLIKREFDDLGSSVNSEDTETFNNLVIKNFYCEICNKYFPRRSSLKRHQRTHVSDKVFTCPHCNKAFTRKEHLSRHMLLHSDTRPFQCQVCLKKYTRKEHVERHILIHPQDPDLGYRTRKFDMEQEKLYQDLEMETQINMICDNKIDILPKGEVLAVPTLERPYICELCNHGFARKEHLQRHKRRMHTVNTGNKLGTTDESKPYSCPICQKTFTRKEHLVRHNKIHLRETLLGAVQLMPSMDIKIPEVPKRANLSVDRIPAGLDVSLSVVEPTKSLLKKNAALLPNKLDISISLVNDAASTSQKEAIEELTNNKQTSEENLLNFLKPFSCDYCFNKRFTRKSHLVRHFKRIHPERDISTITGGETRTERQEFNADTFVSNEDEHLCKICNKHFSRRYHLNRHLKLHIAMKSGKIKEIVDEDDKPFKCSSCNGRFVKYEGFQNHRCTGTEVGSMVLVGNLPKMGRPGSEAGSSCTNSSMDTSLESNSLRKITLNKATDNAVASTSKEPNSILGRRGLKRESTDLKKQAKRDRRKRSRVGYECLACGECFPTKKCLNKHMKIHNIYDEDSNGGDGD